MFMWMTPVMVSCDQDITMADDDCILPVHI